MGQLSNCRKNQHRHHKSFLNNPHQYFFHNLPRAQVFCLAIHQPVLADKSPNPVKVPRLSTCYRPADIDRTHQYLMLPGQKVCPFQLENLISGPV